MTRAKRERQLREGLEKAERARDEAEAKVWQALAFLHPELYDASLGGGYRTPVITFKGVEP